jgi:hypothetical protein
LTLVKDDNFAKGLGLNVQIRTKIVRFWSYIKQAAIRIGDDILEIEGNVEPSTETRYWINFQYQGQLTSVGGFPVKHTIKNHVKHQIEIDLSSKYKNLKIVLSTWKDFVRVEFKNASTESFGNSVGMLGDFATGNTYGRDGSTVLHDFYELGNEWQVLPSEGMLFHDTAEPQFPESCIVPSDPRGARRRRLDEMTVTEEQAEVACSKIEDAIDRKDCVYDVLSTQDIEMVGAY